MNAQLFHTNSETETIALGHELAKVLPRSGTVLLIGNLGAGKTTLAKGIVEGLGVAEADEVSSPTFPLVHEYSSTVYHVDLYRLETLEEVLTIGLEDLFERDALLLIEWGERFRQMMPTPRTEISIEANGDTRTIHIETVR